VLVRELAELTGTTVRTIRYYHQIGLLPVPANRTGRRDYDLTHVARVTRIRWLALAGVPLERVRGMLTPRPARDDVVADLTAAVETIDGQLAQLTAQRERTLRLIDAARAGDALSPLPPAVARFYDDLTGRAADEDTRREIRRERDFMELAYYRGDMPPEAEMVYRGLTEAGMAESLDGFRAIADRATGEVDIESVATAAVERVLRRLGPALPALVASLDPAVARRAADLYVRLSGGGDRPLDRAIADKLIHAIEEARNR
jgi:DNA-binding transcriptional MerR regulator